MITRNFDPAGCRDRNRFFSGLHCKIVFAFAWQMISISIATGAQYPELPRYYIQTPFELPSGGEKFVPQTSSDFQLALNQAQPGDVIELQAGTTYTGPFNLPEKTTGAGWIYIITSAYSSLPSPCNRVSIDDAANMPKLVVKAGSGGAINTASRAHHYRFVGIEFKPVANHFVYNIVYIGNGETQASSLPHDLVFDRCYIHGDPSAGSRRGVLMNGAYISVIDSYIADCKEDGADSQAMAAYSTTGPLKITNCYLEGAGENVIFGGADPAIPQSVPSDIEIRCNTFFKPLSWMSEDWDIKNLLEFKNAQRVLVEGNHFENNWPNAQSGFALLFTPRNQNNTAPWSVVQDITLRFNTFENIAQGLNMSGFDAPNVSQRTSRILIQHNVWEVTNLGMGGDGRLFQVLNGPTDVIFDHNTGFTTNAYMVSDGTPKTDSFVFINNIVTHANYGFIGSGTAYANTTLAMYFHPNWTVQSNLDIGGAAFNYPAGNYFPANIASVGFVDYANRDYRLSPSSIYKNVGTDGQDPGADMDAIALASQYICDSVTGIDDISNSFFSFTLYPNPANETVSVKLTTDQPIQHLVILDINGRMVWNAPQGEWLEEINTSGWANGIYFVRIESNHQVAFSKVIIQH